MRIVQIRVVLFVVAIAVWSGIATAQTYAAMSLVGYELSIVHAGASTGSSRDQNIREGVPMPDRTLDHAALRAVDYAMQKAKPKAKVVMLSGADPRWIEAAKQDLAPGTTDYTALVAGIASAARQVKADRAVLVLPARGDVYLRIERGTIGRGRVSGLGLYVDREVPMRRSDTADTSRGFLGVFANFRVVLVDAASAAVLADEFVASGVAYAAARAEDANPLNTLTSAQKVQTWERLLHEETVRIMPALLAKLP